MTAMTTAQQPLPNPKREGPTGNGLLREPPHPGDRLGRHDATTVASRRHPRYQALHSQEQMAH